MQLRQDLNGMAVFLRIVATARTVEATLAIARPADSDPIEDDTVAVILETRNGRLLKPIDWPEPGALPETSLGGGSTAHARFLFRPVRGQPPKRAIVVLRGDWVEYDLRAPRAPGRQ
jgi:hypothetical protein